MKKGKNRNTLLAVDVDGARSRGNPASADVHARNQLLMQQQRKSKDQAICKFKDQNYYKSRSRSGPACRWTKILMPEKMQMSK